MASVNYFVLGEVFGVLERIELIDGVFFGDFDPDDLADLEELVRKHIMPPISGAHPQGQRSIRDAIAFYSCAGEAPFQLMKDWCQELSLPDSVSWPLFFHRVGQQMYGADYRNQFNPNEFDEIPDEWAGNTVLSSIVIKNPDDNLDR